MKIASFCLVLTAYLSFFSAPENTYTLEQVSICKNGNQCLSSSQKNRIKESDSYTVEVVLTSNSPNFLSEQIQAVQLEVSEILFACARSATDSDNCPSGSSQEWHSLYQNPRPPISTAIAVINSTKLNKQLTTQQMVWRKNIKNPPLIISDFPQKIVKPNLPKPTTYQVRLKAENVQFPDWVWGIRVSVYERDGGRNTSAEFKTRF
jgi:hypothetical protein